jgi:glucose-1-phosphate adenylyltransferase
MAYRQPTSDAQSASVEVHSRRLGSVCPHCGGRVFRDSDGRFCIACGFHAEALNDAVAYVLAGGAGTRLGVLTEPRAKPALPFGGRHRLIDFTLANCANSGVDHVAVLARHDWRSVRAALAVETGSDSGLGWPRDMRLATARGDGYTGTADAVRRTLAFVTQAAARSVLVLSADHVYAMDYRLLLEAHRARRADVTIGVTEVAPAEASRFGIAELDAQGRVRGFAEKPQHPRSMLASMGVYVFTAESLRRLLAQDAADPESSHDFGRDVIPLALREGLHVRGYEFGGYWRDVGTVDAYWAASMDIVRGEGPTGITTWPLVPRPEYHGDAHLGAASMVEDSLLAGDCRVDGAVRRSVVFPGVRVERGAVVTDSVLLPGAVVGRDAVVRRSVVDERAVVDAHARVGTDLGGISVVAAGARISASFNLAEGAAPGLRGGRGNRQPPSALAPGQRAP